MGSKYLVNLAAALIPVVIGAIWYNRNTFGRFLNQPGSNNPPKSMGYTAVVLVITFACGYYIAGSLRSIVIHQYGLLSMLANHPEVHTAGSELNVTVTGLLDKYGSDFRSFKHGALHGSMTGLFLILPILIVITLFESKRWTYLAIHAVYWIICLALMGGVVCAYYPLPYMTH